MMDQSTLRSRRRVALIHATPAAIAPATHAFTSALPHVDLWHLLDDRLQDDAVERGVEGEPAHRMRDLLHYAQDHGAAGIALSCSLFGQVAAAERSALRVPVLTSDEALFEAVGRSGALHPVLVAAQPSAAEDSTRRLRDHLADSSGGEVTVTSAAVTAGPQPLVDRIIEAIGHTEADLVVLANFSLEPAQDEVQRRTGLPVLVPAALAAQQLAAALAH